MSTPLTQLSDSVGEHVGTLGRTGAVVAASSGLVAAMSMSAQASPDTNIGTAVASTDPVTAAPVLAAPAPPVAHLTAAPVAAAPVSAPATASITFDSSAFAARPAPPPVDPAVARERAERRAALARAATREVRTPTATRVTKPVTKVTPKAKPAKKKKATTTVAVGGSQIIAIASRYIGTPYRYGGTTPAGFDCSGFTQYVYRQLGKSLPRTSRAQAGAVDRIPRSQARPGDLVFITSGGTVTHVGIYAGGNSMIDSPRSGKSISKRAIWSSSVFFGRV